MRERLSDGVITLHRYRLKDVPDLVAAARESVGTVFPWLPWCHKDYTTKEARAWVASQVKAWNERKSFEFVIRHSAFLPTFFERLFSPGNHWDYAKAASP